MRFRYPAMLVPLLCLCACGPEQADGVGGVSAAEASALNNAAAMLDARAGAATGHEPGINPAATAAARADRGRRVPEAVPVDDTAR